MTVLLALTAALSWGTADFFAGLASRRIAVPVVLAIVQVGGLVVILVVALATASPWLTETEDVVSAAGAGLGGMLGLACFYRGLAIGTMSVVAPISASGVALPVLVGLATGDRPGPGAALGLATIVLGVVLVSRDAPGDVARARSGRRAVGLALLAAVGLGSFLALSDAPSDVSVPWTLVLARTAALPLVLAVIAVQRPRLPPPRLAVGLLAVACLDLLATALLGLANREGDLSVVSVLGSMYPVMTVLLAAVVLHERLRGTQLAGAGMALGGVGLVAAG